MRKEKGLVAQPKVCIVGLGYVGSYLFKKSYTRLDTYGCDLDADKVDRLNKTYRLDPQILTLSISDHKSCNIYVFCIDTPVDKNSLPDLERLRFAISCCSESCLARGDTVVIESTVSPGETNDIIIPLIEKKSGLKVGEDINVVYSPERVDPGVFGQEFGSKIVAGFDQRSLDIGLMLYQNLGFEVQISKVGIREAELAKLIENAQRFVNIQFLNEIYLQCIEQNFDFNAVISLASGKSNFYRVQPGIVGGHCLPVDSFYLENWYVNQGPGTSSLIKCANELNVRFKESMLDQIRDAASLSEAKNVLIVGCGYKPGIMDARNSGAAWLVDRLQEQNFIVSICDDYWKDFDFEVVLLDDEPLVIFISHWVGSFFEVIADESVFRNLFKSNRFIIDPKNILGSNVG